MSTREQRRKWWRDAKRRQWRSDKRKWRLAHPDHKEDPELHRVRNLKWAHANPDKVRASRSKANRKFNRANPEQHRVQVAVYRAIKAGKLVREPCEICGDPRSHAHHDDYSKPFEVRWFCALHHKLYHKYLIEHKQQLCNLTNQYE